MDCKKWIGRVRGVVATAGKAVVAVGGAALVGVNDAQAALTFTGIELNTADVESLMMLVIPALATLWGFRKIVKTANRS